MCSERRRQRWLNHTRHLGGARQAASALGSTLVLLEKVAQPLGGSPWAAGLGTWAGAPWAGGRSSSVSCQHPFGVRLRAAGWERLTAWNCPRALVWGHKTPQLQRFHPFSLVTSCPRVEAKLLLWMSLAFFGWDLHQATAGVSGTHHKHPWPGQLPNTFQRTGQTINLIIFGNETFFVCANRTFSSCSSKKPQQTSGKILRNNNNEKGVLLTYMPNIKAPVSSRTWIRFLQMTILPSWVFALDKPDSWCQEEKLCSHSSKTLNNLPTLSPSSVCSSKVGLSVYKRRLGHKSPFITLQSRLSCSSQGKGLLTVPERHCDGIKLGTRVSKTGIK